MEKKTTHKKESSCKTSRKRSEGLKYNDNITIVSIANSPTTIAKNEYYALMVTDYNVAYNPEYHPRGDTRNFFDRQRGWLGLERTSGGKIYISKDFSIRHNQYRGDTVVVHVANPEQCYILDMR
jgi:hypothetical protein